MVEVKFSEGRVFHINDDSEALYILQGVSEHSDKAPEILIDSYQRGNFPHLTKYIQGCESYENRKYQDLVNCLFADVEDMGEDEMCKVMFNIQYIMFYVSNGLPVPGGPVPWE